MNGVPCKQRRMLAALSASLLLHGVLLATLPPPVGSRGDAALPPLPRLTVRLAERLPPRQERRALTPTKTAPAPAARPTPASVGLRPLPRLAQLSDHRDDGERSGTLATAPVPVPPEFYRRSQLDTPPRPRHNLDLLEHWMDAHQETLVLVFKLWVDDAGHIVRAEAEPPAPGETLAEAIRERYVLAIQRRLLALQFEPGYRQQQPVNGITYLEVTVEQRPD